MTSRKHRFQFKSVPQVKLVWKLVDGDDETPAATQRHRSWSEVLGAALLQGAIFGFVKALVDRAGAAGFEQATGQWPGDGQPRPFVESVPRVGVVGIIPPPNMGALVSDLEKQAEKDVEQDPQLKQEAEKEGQDMDQDLKKDL